jgi:hypothetical protein
LGGTYQRETGRQREKCALALRAPAPASAGHDRPDDSAVAELLPPHAVLDAECSPRLIEGQSSCGQQVGKHAGRHQVTASSVGLELRAVEQDATELALLVVGHGVTFRFR